MDPGLIEIAFRYLGLQPGPAAIAVIVILILWRIAKSLIALNVKMALICQTLVSHAQRIERLENKKEKHHGH